MLETKGPEGMRVFVHLLVVFLFCGAVLPVRAGVSVSSYHTEAQANGYAPLDQSAYYVDDNHPNASPATGDVSGNWTGTNAGGGVPTWNMVATANINTATTAIESSLTITAAGSFSYEMKTFAGFLDPSRSTTLYVPGAAADYESQFIIDSPGRYSMSVILNRFSIVHLSSFTNGDIVNENNFGSIPRSLSFAGILQPGQYSLQADAGNAGPIPLNDGVNDITRSGSFTGFSFSVQVPEPAGILVFTVGYGVSRRRSRLHPRQKRR
jgi:hypothetical protein